MKKMTKTFNVLEEKDVEELVSKAVGREVKLSEIEISLIDLCPLEDIYEGIVENCGLDCEVIVDGAKVFDYDNLSGPLDGYLPDQVYIDLKYVFAFSVKKFKSFERYTDSSDI